MLDAKYTDALEISLLARGVVDPGVTEQEMRGWTPDELYLWLRAWDYVWDGDRWGGMQRVWIAVDEEGGWRQRILGIYTSEDAAQAACTSRYHSYACVTLNVGEEVLRYVYPNE